MITAMMLTACASPARDCAKQPMIMIINSIPSAKTYALRNCERGIRDPLRTHALTTNEIRKPSEEQLTDESADRRSNFDTEVLVGGQSSSMRFVVDVAQHRRSDVNLPAR